MEDQFLINLFFDDECISTINTVVTSAITLFDSSKFIDNLGNDLLYKKDRDKDCPYNDICNYSHKEYKETFKMSREIVEKLINYLKEKSNADISRMTIPFEKKVHILLYTLGSTEPFNSISNFFGVPKSSISLIFRAMCKLVAECKLDFIKWPNIYEQNVIKSKVRRFPNCVGFIDCCQLQIRSALNNEENINTKKKTAYSIILQAVCDNTLKFTDIFLGDVGVVSHFEVFKSSPLSEKLEYMMNNENHILGNIKYPLKLNLMTPFRKPRVRDQKNYNKSHSGARMVIRRSFGRLKAKFRRLKHIDAKNLETASVAICAACVLHNFILIHDPDEENDIVKYENQNTLNFDTYAGSLSAKHKRDYICRYINGHISI